MSRISRDEVLRVADLARLSLDDVEAGALAAQLDTILAYAEVVRSVDTEGVAPTAHPLPVRMVLREDRAEPPLPPEEALANAPEREGSAFVVPKVLDADEG
ncbi:MAG TPA: Asp-tRNA(Asn)/Glu-tRNA(Gln) amidotransferase subunit GatC [Myxococcota bacterium]|nr:Asp-tRNA(Asn)/Glu-tRNA(Gln) amidotransferase subunit GatC [Myxococcota bacterium]